MCAPDMLLFVDEGLRAVAGHICRAAEPHSCPWSAVLRAWQCLHIRVGRARTCTRAASICEREAVRSLWSVASTAAWLHAW